MAQSRHTELVDKDRLPSDTVICYEYPEPVTRHALLEGLEKTGILLLRGVNPDSADELLNLGRMLGTIDVGIDKELLGALVMHLRYNPNLAPSSHQPAYFTSNFFPLHTDVSYVPNPPRFMLLQCVHPDPEGGGINLLADCNQALALLTDAERSIIRQPIFNFLYPPNCAEGQSQAYAILGDGLWRYKGSSMFFPEEAKIGIDRFNQVLADISFPLLLERGDVLIIDNHRIVHGRTAFKRINPNLPGRHIMRLYATTLS